MKIKVIFTKDLYPYTKHDIAEVSKEVFERHAGKFMEKYEEPKKEEPKVPTIPAVPNENKAIKKETVIKK
jgi:hypothetical protein